MTASNNGLAAVNTPALDLIRERAIRGGRAIADVYGQTPGTNRGYEWEFDAWLAAHDAEVKAAGKREGWDEGYGSGWTDRHEAQTNPIGTSLTTNPYNRTETPNE